MTNGFITQLRVTLFSRQVESWQDPEPLRILLKEIAGRESDREEGHRRTEFCQVQAYDHRRVWQHTIRRFPHRIDVLQEAVFKPDAATQRFTKLVPAPEVLKDFVGRNRACERLWQNVEVHRIAVGTSLRWSRDSLAEVVAALRESLPSLELGPKDRDIVFRLNRPTSEKDLEGKEIEFNRIETWKIEGYSILILPGGQTSDPRFALVLDTDCNTDARRDTPFNGGDAVAMLDTCQKATLDIWAKGPRQ